MHELSLLELQPLELDTSSLLQARGTAVAVELCDALCQLIISAAAQLYEESHMKRLAMGD